MSNNFMGVGGNSALSKSSTDGILNLLQLSLLGNNAGVNVNASAVPTSTITSLNSGIVPNSNNIMTAKANFYPQNVVPNLSGLGGVGNMQQSIISQSQINSAQPIVKTGRPIVNTANLAANNAQQHQQKRIERAHTIANVREMNGMSDQSIGNTFHMPSYIRGTSYNGAISKEEDSETTTMQSDSMINEFKNALRIISSDVNNCAKQQQHRNNTGDNGSFSEFGEFVARDNYFNASSNNTMNNSANNFPIGTFSIEQATQPAANQTFPQTDYFNPATASQLMSNGINGTTATHSFPSTNAHNNNNSNSTTTNNNNGSGDGNQATRETGIIEKLLQHSYGFIQCCERQARLFFHFSQFSGNIEHLKIGDPVEFEMTYDRRTGKPIASQVTKIAPEVVLSEERVTGTVTTEIKQDGSASETTTGRISYENRGECFFLPYTKDDVEGNVVLSSGDKVSFQIATNQRGNLGACHIRLENPVHPVKYRGVVCSMKESFGFIERADVVKEIFFHFSEAEGTVELRPGDDVEFIIQTRNGKEVACNISRLPPGSVVFEDIGTLQYKGQVLKPLERANPVRHNNDPLPGRIRYRATDHSEVEVPFGDKDQKGDFTLRHGDWVQFLLATDRRDQLQRATSISLLEETFELSGERREQGMVASLKDGFGFLRCVDRNVRLFFHFTEVLDTTREIRVGDEVEFTAIQEPGSSFANNRLSAIRIKHLPPGKVQFETLMETNIEGTVTREAPRSPVKSQERMEGGVITYTQANTKKTIMYFLKDCEKPPRVGDNVRFDICQVKRNKELIAVNIVDVLCIQHQMQHSPSDTGNGVPTANAGNNADSARVTVALTRNLNGKATTVTDTFNDANGGATNSTKYQGFVAVLKENFGFIETIQHDEEVFFHFSNFIGNPSNLELGQEVEYTLSKRNGSNSGNCLPAENVKILTRGSIPQPKVLDSAYNGIVTRPLRCINPDQEEYSGLIQLINDAGESVSSHEFGITSLINKRDLLQKDDPVVFKVDEASRAVDVTAVRKKKRAIVDSIKGQFGFLNFEVDEGKKLFFHMSEVHGNHNNLYPGDSVEFSVVTNQRNGKSSACNVVKISENVAPRPDRLLSRLKLNNSIDESVPRLIVIRSPKGPEGKGFSSAYRQPRLVGVFAE
ncbi:cold shock domain-containing protein E1 isoform X3 [Sitodiplosis mosellana]|uniref:cold shock domain-containing protein E1 isoform X3 n=1 Tax=Sitodiplosis mosellana TaxID=263140 RepID=UPI002444B4B3|nr:cold shock domain-containing protein E1 isoform X3 [Sitodiplosis mosellana]XP_055310651.1 cold shock domain-containing protein E1 isoform X3 [Sitodiplosis mosellana]